MTISINKNASDGRYGGKVTHGENSVTIPPVHDTKGEVWRILKRTIPLLVRS